MPQIKSAEKRVSVSAKKKLQNQMIRSQMNTAVKKFNAAISSNDLATAEALFSETSSKIDNAAVKGVIHKNCANHKKAQVAKALYQLKNGIIVIKVDAKTLKQAEQKAAASKKAEAGEAIRAQRNAARTEKEAQKAPAKKPTAAKKAPAKTTETATKKPATPKKKVEKAPVEEPVDTTDEVK